MKLGLQIPSFTWAGGPPEIGARLGSIARGAEAAGYDSIWVMDHFFQIRSIGAPELEMLESYTALGYVAALTSRVDLGALVTGVTYRHPGILAKEVTTLDVLSRGRAWLGIGAAWNEQEHRGLGVPFPPARERLERLEEAVRICLQMWSDSEEPFEGAHYRLERTLNSPQGLTRPHPPIMIGGSGERKTLRLVAKYADACNLFGDPATLRHKLEVLEKHCVDVGRTYEDIERTCYYAMDVGADGSRVETVLDELRQRADAGIQRVVGRLASVEDPKVMEVVATEVIPEAARL